MTSVSGRYLELAALTKRELDQVFAAGTPPEATAITGFEFLGFNHPRAAAMLGIRKFIKVFYLDESGRPFGCNTPVVQNGLGAEWIHRPSAGVPKRYAFFQVLAGAADGLLLDYGRGGNPPVPRAHRVAAADDLVNRGGRADIGYRFAHHAAQLVVVHDRLSCCGSG